MPQSSEIFEPIESHAFEPLDIDLQSQHDDDADPFAHDPSVEYSATPIWREGIWPLEFFKLICHPVYAGRGVVHGKGEPVVVIPGFLANDLLMLPMRQWLNRIGYKAHASHIFWNTDCPNETARRLARQVEVISQRSGQKVRLVGHSLGGMLAKSVLQKVPECVDRVVAIGSPFRETVKAHPAVVRIWDYLIAGKGKLVGRHLHGSCASGYCMCDFVHHMLSPETLDIPQYSIYSRRDGVVDWRSCTEDDQSLNSEVGASHIGLAFDVNAYRALAERLAEQTSTD